MPNLRHSPLKNFYIKRVLLIARNKAPTIMFEKKLLRVFEKNNPRFRY